MLRRLPLVVTVMLISLAAQPLLATDDITIQVQSGQNVGAGFGELTQGPHDLRVTFQVNGTSGGMSGLLSDSSGYGMWSCISRTSYRMTFLCERSLEDMRGLVTGGGYLYDPTNPLNSGNFSVSLANATFPCANAPYNPYGGMSGNSGTPCDVTKEGETVLSPGWRKSVTIKVAHSMPGLLTIEGGNDDLKIMTGSGRTAPEFTDQRLTGQGTEAVTVWLKASRTFSGDKQLRVKFKHDNGPLDTQDLYNVKAGPPRPEALVDLDTDSNNDGAITDDDDPIEEAAPGLLLFAIPDAEPGDHGDLGPCKLAVILQDPSLDLDGYTVVLSGTGSASFKLWKDATATEELSQGTPYPVLSNGTGAPFPSQFVVEATNEGDGSIQAILFDPTGVQVDQDVVLAQAEANKLNPMVVEIKDTYVVPQMEALRLKAIPDLDDRAEAFNDLLKAEFGFNNMGLDLTTIGSLDMYKSDAAVIRFSNESGTILKGFSGFCVAMKSNAKRTVGGTRHDFRECKIRFMAFRCVWDMQDADPAPVAFANLQTPVGAGTTEIHEKWHTEGLDGPFLTRARMGSLGVVFHDTKPPFVAMKDVPSRPGYVNGAKAYAVRLTRKLKTYKTKPANNDDATSNWHELAVQNFMGLKPQEAIGFAGEWHDGKDGTAWKYNADPKKWWHPDDVLGAP